MNKFHSDLIQTLSILICLQNGKEYEDAISKLIKDAPDTSLDPLFVRRQLVKETDMTIFDYTLSLKELGKRGYVLGYTFFDRAKQDELYESFNKNPKEHREVNAQIKPITEPMGEAMMNAIVPEHLKDDLIEVPEEETDLQSDFENYEKFVKSKDDDMFSYVWLLPFRDYESLLEQLKRGVDLEDVIEKGISYNEKLGILYINKNKFQLNLRGDKSNIHHILMYMQKHGLQNVHYFAEMNSKEILGEDSMNRRYQDAVLKLQARIKKENPDLHDVFRTTTMEVQINPDYLFKVKR